MSAMHRRDALRSLGALAGAAAAPKLLACGGNDISDGSRPTGITTLVTVCMENRSYDHYLGARALEGLGGNGLSAASSNPDGRGNDVAAFRDSIFCIPDPPHSWDSCRRQVNGGAMDGFLTEFIAHRGSGIPAHAMGYLTRADLPFSWALADEFAVCDAWFSSILGPTWPNRMYLHSGQSGGIKVNDLPEAGGIGWRSIHHQLQEAGVPWAYYFQDLPFAPLFKGVEVQGTVKWFHNRFFQDAANGELPPVVWIEPNFGLHDDHPPHHPMLGQQFLASIYHALANSPQWENCLLVITYDEHGGFYDHVPPPKTADERAGEGFDQLGVRVPTLIAGPYVKPGYVSETVYDHTSVLKHISTMFELAPLTERVAAANDLRDCIDLDRLAAGDPRGPRDVPAIEVDESQITDACYRIASGQPELEELLDSGVLSAEFDGRGQRRDAAYAIGDFLDSVGGGRIIRGR